MSEIQEWYYKGRADKSFGAKYNNPMHKIFLIVGILCTLILCGAAVILRDYIYDITVNPQIVLKFVQYDEQTGYVVDVPYKYDFVADKFIDPENTLKYNYFMDPNVKEYTYKTEGTVDTNTLGSYKVVYTSANRMHTQQIELTVRVTDNEAPTINFNDNVELTQTEQGLVYKVKQPVVRDATSNNENLGSLDFDPKSYIESIIDDYDGKIDIDKVQFAKINWNEDLVPITYTVSDAAKNSCSVNLYVTVIDANDPDHEAAAARIKEMEKELNELLNPSKKEEEDKDKETSKADVKLTADDVTWSITKNGALSGVIAKATQNIHYNGEGTFYPSSGAFVIEPVTEPGNYTINWTSTDGLMCSQKVIVVE